MEEPPSWATLFERGAAFGTDLEAVRAAVGAVRDREGADGG